MRPLSLILMVAFCLGCTCPLPKDKSSAKDGFIHVVYFWLKDDATSSQKQQLIDDCFTYLGTVKTVRHIEVGTPAGTPREVVDNSYGVCLIVYFDNREGHDYYQKAEKHLQFIARNKKTWTRVQVYDMLPRK